MGESPSITHAAGRLPTKNVRPLAKPRPRGKQCSSVIARFPLAFLAILSVIGSAAGIVRRDDVPDSAYQQLGSRAAFRSVGRVEIDYGRGYQAIGTATLYGPDRIVSAAHVFDKNSLNGAVRVRVNFGKGHVRTIDFTTPGAVNINPGYNPDTLKNDVSVSFLSRPFNLAPARLYAGKKLRLDSRVTFVGYGDTGTGLTGSSVYSSRKRGGENALGRYLLGGKDFEVDFDRPGTARYNSFGSPLAFRLEGLLGSGDSGGSAWVYKNRRWQMIGINSYGIDWFPRGDGDGVEDNYGDRSGFVYLPRYAEWLASLENPALTATAGSARAALAVSPVPEARPLILLGLAATLLLVFRRRPRRA